MRISRFAGRLTATGLFCLVLLGTSSGLLAAPKFSEKPKIRALTAFVPLDRAHYREQISDALGELRTLKAAFEQAGYEVQTIRISTQPFFKYTQGLPDDQVLAFFRDYDALAVRKALTLPSVPPCSRIPTIRTTPNCSRKLSPAQKHSKEQLWWQATTASIGKRCARLPAS